MSESTGDGVSVVEGLAKVEVPAGRVCKSDDVFYNPRMRICRDLSVLSALVFLENYNIKEGFVLDAFAASGIRGLRYLLECRSHVGKVVFNDLNPKALDCVRHNLGLNGIDKSRAELMMEDARVAMLRLRNKCDVVDIDPFGSPSKYIDCAAEAMAKISMLGVTATDTAPLCGTYPVVCYRKYLATSYRYDGMYEAGLRILAAYIIRIFAKHEKAFLPVICFGREHFLRVQGVVKRNLREVDRLLLKRLGYLSVCENCGHRVLAEEKTSRCEVCGSEKVKNAGPLWTGEFLNEGFCKSMARKIEKEVGWLSDESVKVINLLQEEARVKKGLIYDTHFVCKKWKLKFPPRVERLVEALKDHGHDASRTHLKPTAIRTTARIDEIVEVSRKMKM